MRLIKLKVNDDDWGFKIGDIVEYKFFCELSKQEKEESVGIEALYDDKNVFIKVKTTENPNIWGYMRDCEFEFIKTEDTDKPKKEVKMKTYYVSFELEEDRSNCFECLFLDNCDSCRLLSDEENHVYGETWDGLLSKCPLVIDGETKIIK
jgi:hypothetical protein